MSIPQSFASNRIPRHWVVRGPAGAGKSTFLTALRGPVLLVDADQRGAEIAQRAPFAIRPLSLVGRDNTDPLRISELLHDNGPEIARDFRTVAVDSLTAILSPVVALAMEGNRRGLNKNKAAAFLGKSQVLRLIQDTLASLGTDVVYIWHEERGRNEKGEAIVRQSVSEIERKRLQRSLNAVLVVSCDKTTQKRILRIEWSRSGHGAGHTFSDTTGCWAGIPEQIDAALAGADRKEA
jgi:hypothetical protein